MFHNNGYIVPQQLCMFTKVSIKRNKNAIAGMINVTNLFVGWSS